jgi:hypothetical protein
MADQPIGEGVPRSKDTLPESALGGADAVNDTHFVPDREPLPQRRKGEGPVVAQVPAGSGQGATWAIIAFLLVGAVLVFLLGFGQ